MLKEKPWIHLMKTPYGYYLFDVNTSMILQVEKPVYDYLSRQQRDLPVMREEPDRKTEKTVEGLKSKGFLSAHRPKEIVHPADEYLEYYLENKLGKMTLQLTQQCNFRCSYCIYSEYDMDLQRKHSNKRMSYETAKKAIDFLVEHSRDNEDINIGFYGGEPLLEFDLIQKCIEYAEYACEGKDLSFSITTNGSLLNPEIAEYLINHNVSVLISLDGPRQIQDRHRRFAADGCGTFDRIEENIRNIREKCPEFLKKISFNMVIDPQDDFSCINSFLADYELFKETDVRGSLIDDTYSNEKLYFSEDYIIKSNYEYFKVFLFNLGRINADAISPIAKMRFGDVEKLFNNDLNVQKIPDKVHHAGPCIPGAHKVFVTVDGNFFVCERVSELSQVMNIGSLDTGYNVESIRNLLNVGKLTENSCKNCWAITNCSLCAKFADNMKELSAELKKSQCSQVRRNFENVLLDYIALMEIKAISKEKIV